MGFMLGDPFNYSPVRKMAEAITFRTEEGIFPDCPAACGNAEVTARPYTLKQYYQEDMQSGGDFHHNRPFHRFFVRGDTTWKDDDYTLKLNDVSGSDGATKLDVEPSWLVRLKIGAKFGYWHENYDDLGLLEDFEDGVNPNIIRVDGWDQGQGASDAGYYYTIVLLDGDEGDYVAFDLDAEHGDIGQFVIKVGGVSYSAAAGLDEGQSVGVDEPIRIELLGVSYKPYFTTDDEDGDGNGDSNGDGNGDDVLECTINDQCAEGEICESGTCVEKIEGCLDSNSSEYDSSANVDDGTCISCKTGYEKDTNGLCTLCVEGYTMNAAGNCYEDEEETDFPWLAVAGIGIALVLVIS
jgi:hypothetical protein